MKSRSFRMSACACSDAGSSFLTAPISAKICIIRSPSSRFSAGVRPFDFCSYSRYSGVAPQDAFARAAEFVDWRKQNRLRLAAELWLSQHETELQPRFDVIEIYAPAGEDTKKPVINHLEDAFQ